MCIVSFASAQETLNLEQALETALKNNYAIGIARVQSAAATNNNNIGNAGFLPSVVFNASNSLSNNNTKQEYSNGLNINKSGVGSTGLNAGVALNWTLFDGFKMFATHQRLKEIEAQGLINIKVQIENTVAAIVGAYYDVVRQTQLIKATNDNIKIYEERIKIAQKKADIGSGSRIDLLQAKVDLNTQKAALLKLRIALDNAKASLNQLLSRPGDQEFMVNDSIVVNYAPAYSELKKTLVTNNNQLLFAQKNSSISEQLVKESQSQRLPQIEVNAIYNFSQTKNQVGLVLLNQNLGLNIGLTASWTLFNGFKTRTQVRNAYFMVQQNELLYKQTNTIVEAALIRAWKTFNYSVEAMKLEEDNILLARENVNIAMERFRIGSSTSIELMFAQKSYEEALSRLLAARYDAKLAETELKRLNGELVK